MPQKSRKGASRLDGGRVFISHDSRDAELAEALGDLIEGASAGLVKPFRSSDRKGSSGIPSGELWYPRIMQELGAAGDVVCLLTRRSIGRPWILYEAGIAAGSKGRRIHGLAVGISLEEASVGPFAQFQNTENTPDAVAKMVVGLVKRHGGSSDLRPEHVAPHVAQFRQRAEAALKHAAGDDVFLAVPMAALGHGADAAARQAAFAAVREEALTVIAALKKYCGVESVFYAGEKIATFDDFESSVVAVKDDMAKLTAARRFVMLYPSRHVSSVIFEAGVALALRKPSLYLVRRRSDLPFLMVEAAGAFSCVRIHECATIEATVNQLKADGLKAFPDAP